jgi:hypothetical protein
MPFDVFLSHSSKDKTAVDAVCAALESAGIRCWVAPRDVRAGVQYATGIMEGIDSCRVMVLIFSSHANASQQVHREIERAASKGLIIIPFRIEEAMLAKPVEYFLGQIHWLDAVTPPLARHLGKLVEQVNANLHVDRASPKGNGHAEQELYVQIGGIVVCLGAALVLLWNGVDGGFWFGMIFLLLGVAVALIAKTIPLLRQNR